MGTLQATVRLQQITTLLHSPEALAFNLLKLIFVAGALLYLIFALLVIRQINLMSNTIKTDPSKIMKILGLIHFGVAGLVLLLFIIIL